jgi:hypothetical protein
MSAHRKPRCEFCLKELSNAKHVHLHITNTPKCRQARDQLIRRRSPSPLVDTPNRPNLDPMTVDDENGFAGHDETNLDYIPGEQLGANNVMVPNQSQSELTKEVENDDAPGRYAEEYIPVDVAHILRKSRTAFETLKEDQNYAGLGETPWAPFKDEDEWQLARFLIKEVSQTAANKYLKLSIVSGGILRRKGLN